MKRWWCVSAQYLSNDGSLNICLHFLFLNCPPRSFHPPDSGPGPGARLSLKSESGEVRLESCQHCTEGKQGVLVISVFTIWITGFSVISCSLSIPKQRIALGESRYLWGLYEQEGRFGPLCIATLPDTCSIIVTKTTRRPAACPMCCVSTNYKLNYCSCCFCGIIIGSSLISPPRLWWSWPGW